MHDTKPREPRRVAVIGAGFIGTHVAARLLHAGVETVVVNRSPLGERKERLLLGADIAIVDANASELLRPVLADVEHVVYCASGLMPAESNLDPVADATISLPPLIRVLDILRARPTTGLTFLSSGGTVYGHAPGELIREDHPTEPVTSYGIIKLTCEKYALMHHQLYEVPVQILRLANVYGQHQPATRSQGVVAVFLDRIARGLPIPLYGDGSIVRDYVHVDDVADIILQVIRWDGKTPLTLNVGSGIGYTLVEIITRIEALIGRQAVIDSRPGRSFDVKRVVLDIGRVRSLFGFVPTPLDDGLLRTWTGRPANG